jgi:hypothetical protein
VRVCGEGVLFELLSLFDGEQSVVCVIMSVRLVLGGRGGKKEGGRKEGRGELPASLPSSLWPPVERSWASASAVVCWGCTCVL